MGVVQLMMRVVILGRGASGKSTLARTLGAITRLPVIELDKIFCVFSVSLRNCSGGYLFLGGVAKIRRTEVRPMLSWRAIWDLLSSERRSLRT